MLLLIVFFNSCNKDRENKLSDLNGFIAADLNEPIQAFGFTANQSSPLNSNNIIEEQKIIKTAHLDFETDGLEQTHQHILALIKEHKGTIQKDNSGKEYNTLYHRLTIRVPSQKFDAVIRNISKGVRYFDRREISQKDVTEEFVDIKARLKAKHELEKRYLQLLKQAKNVTEMLEIERQLAIIREEIESREGRLQYLQSQVSMSTIHLKFYKTTADTKITTSYGQKIKNALQNGWQGVSAFFLGILTLWPLVIFVIIAILVIRRYLRRRRNKKK